MSVDQNLVQKSEDVIKRIEQYVSDKKIEVIAETDAKIQAEKKATMDAVEKSI